MSLPTLVRWRRALLAALPASLVSAEIIRESHDTFALALGSDSLALYATCGMASQVSAAVLVVVLSGMAAGLPSLARPLRIAIALVAPILMVLAGNSIGIDGKEGDGVVTENIGMFRVREFPLFGETPVRCTRGCATVAVSQGPRIKSFFRGLPPWCVRDSILERICR